MKEIDFLPEWYKSGRRRQVNYRVQYILLSGAFSVMMVWNFVAANSISKVQAKYDQMQTTQTQSERVSNKLAQFKNEMALLHEKEKVLDSIDSNIIVSNVLAEISFLVDERIILSRVELISEAIEDNQNKKEPLQSASVVRTANSMFSGNAKGQIGDICFKVLITGVAANGSDVAALLCKLEDSPYFDHVDLSYSREAMVKRKYNSVTNTQDSFEPDLSMDRKSNNKSEENIQVSQFEINCYLSNYREH